MSLFRDFLSLSFSKIPSRYQEVEYIGVTDGDSYIDLDYIPTVYTKIELNATLTSLNANGKFLIGSNGGWGNGNVTITATLCSFGTDWFRYTIPSDNHDFVISKDGYYVDDVLKATFTNVFYIAPFSLYLFANDQSGEAVEFGKGNVYKIKIYENDVLKAEYYPCYKKSDQQVGLYDVIRNKFCFPSGEGTWIKGNNVN